MINIDNHEKLNPEQGKNEGKSVETKPKHPNETSGIYLRAHIKIFDPESGEVFVENPA